MSEKEVKRPGRDISDLKARLGLKKAGGDGRPAAGAKAGGFVPPPPGVAPPQPQGPIIPDARVDPFGAMNAMAQQGAAQAAPQIVIVNDGKPVESVQSNRSKTVYIKWAAAIVVPLILGVLVGGISQANKSYNATIDDAGKLTKLIQASGKPLQSIYDALLIAKERGPDKQSFLLGDKDLTAAFEALKLSEQKPDKTQLFHSNLYNLDPQVVEDTLTYYGDLTELFALIDTHVKLSKSDSNRIDKESDVLKPFGGANVLFGAVINVPKDASSGPPTIELVQLGDPLCGPDNAPRPGGCGGAPPSGFMYRPDPGVSAWGKKTWAKEGVAPENIFLVGQNKVLETLTKGSDKTYDELTYMKRVNEIFERTTALIETRKRIENALNQKAQESKRFSL